MLKRILSILCIFIAIIAFGIYPLTITERHQHLSQFSGDNDSIDNDNDKDWVDKDGDGFGSNGVPYDIGEDTDDTNPSAHPSVNTNRKWGVDEPDEGDYDDISIFRGDILRNSNYTVKSLLSSPTTLVGMVDPKDTLLIVTGIEKQYKRSELDAIVDFVKSGGKAIVADDFGYANELAARFDVAYYKGLYLDREFIRNTNFTVIAAKLSIDSDNNGVWDEDNDDNGGDGSVDEDPINYIDDDRDWVLKTDDKNGNGQPDPGEAHVDEDPFDDDSDNSGHPFNYDGIDNDRNGYIDDGSEGVNEEELDGRDNDRDGKIDEDTRPFDLVLNRPTGLYVPEVARIIAQGSKNSFVDMNGDGIITVPEVGDETENELADELGPIKVITEISVCPECGTPILPSAKQCSNSACGLKITTDVRKQMGRIIFIADGSIFTNNLIQIDELDTSGRVTDDLDNNGRPDGDGEWDYDNLAFGKALVQYLLPGGGMVVIDESRHAQDRFIEPIANALEIVALMTSDTLYRILLLVGLGAVIVLVYLFVRGKENWIHKFNIYHSKHRSSMPNTATLQTVRFRRTILEKARLSRGLSPEEFNSLRPDEIAAIIRDPVLTELAIKEDASFNSQELESLANRIKSWS